MFPSYYGSCDNQESIPTNVSIATGATGNYDNACVIEGNSSGVLEDGSNFDNGRVTVEVAAVGSLDNVYSFYAYLRATGANQFRWTVRNFAFTWTNTGDPELDPGDGDAGAGQDNSYPASGPLGCTVNLTSAPSAGDEWSLEIEGACSQGAGTEVTAGLVISCVYS